MRRIVGVALAVGLLFGGVESAAMAEDRDVTDETHTVPNAVRVILIKAGGSETVRSVTGRSTGHEGCGWTVIFVNDLDDVTYGMTAGPKPDPDARLALLLCDGTIVQPIWVAPKDVIDLDAAARDEAQRYIEDVLVP